MALDALQGVKGIGRQVALAAMRAHQNGHIFDDEEGRTASIAARDVAQPDSGFATNRAR
jgi:hypothetical protein